LMSILHKSHRHPHQYQIHKMEDQKKEKGYQIPPTQLTRNVTPQKKKKPKRKIAHLCNCARDKKVKTA